MRTTSGPSANITATVSRSPNFSELRKREVRHSPAPIGPGPPARECSYRRLLCIVGYYAPTADIGAEEGLGIGVGQSEESEPLEGAL